MTEVCVPRSLPRVPCTPNEMLQAGRAMRCIELSQVVKLGLKAAKLADKSRVPLDSEKQIVLYPMNDHGGVQIPTNRVQINSGRAGAKNGPVRADAHLARDMRPCAAERINDWSPSVHGRAADKHEPSVQFTVGLKRLACPKSSQAGWQRNGVECSTRAALLSLGEVPLPTGAKPTSVSAASDHCTKEKSIAPACGMSTEIDTKGENKSFGTTCLSADLSATEQVAKLAARFNIRDPREGHASRAKQKPRIADLGAA